jgi:hypothetical protein
MVVMDGFRTMIVPPGAGRAWMRPLKRQWVDQDPRRRDTRAIRVVFPLRSGGSGGDDVATVFRTLANEWRSQTFLNSTAQEKVTHPAYLRIISMGDRVLPLILADLDERQSHWYWALRAIVGRDVGEGARSLDEARAMWLAWARSEGYVGSSLL